MCLYCFLLRGDFARNTRNKRNGTISKLILLPFYAFTLMKDLHPSVVLRRRERANGTYLYLDITVNGKRHTESLHLKLTGGKSREDKERDKETIRLAEAIAAKRVTELHHRSLGISDDSDNVLVHDLLDRLIDRKEGTTKASWRVMKMHMLRYDPDTRMAFRQADRQWCAGFRAYLEQARTFDIDSRKHTLGKPLASGTRALVFQKFKSLFNMAVKEGVIGKSPCAGLEPFKEEYAPREFLTRDELTRLIATPAPDETVRRAFLFSCFTGLRWSDIIAVRWGDLVPMGGRQRLVFRQQKTGGLEYLDLSPQAVKVLQEHNKTAQDGVQDKDRLVFDGITNKQDARMAVTAWVRAAGIDKHITFHCGRHTFAVMMLDLGVDLYTVSKLLGHRSIETTQVYARILDKNKQAAVDLIPDFL